MKKNTGLVGKKYKMKHGSCRIVEYVRNNRIFVRFDSGFETWCQLTQLQSGKLSDPNAVTVGGIGRVGVGEYKPTGKLYRLWFAMLQRVQRQTRAYLGVTIDEAWHNFQTFCADIVKMPNWNTPGYEMDKDLKVWKSNHYSKKTVSFVPAVINALFVGNFRSKYGQGITQHWKKYRVQVMEFGKNISYGSFASLEEARSEYVRRKSKYVKRLAKQYRDVLHAQVYKNLINWQKQHAPIK